MSMNKDDLFYVCTMIEYVARATHNRSRDIVSKLSDDELEHQLKVAAMNGWKRFILQREILIIYLPAGIRCRLLLPLDGFIRD